MSKHMRIVTIALLAVGILYFAINGLWWMLGAIRPQAPRPPADESMPASQLRAALHELLLDRETRVLLESLVSEAERGRMVAAVTTQMLASPNFEEMIAGLLEGPQFRQAVKELLHHPELQALIVPKGITPELVLGLVEDMLSTTEGKETLARLARELLPLVTDG